MMDQLTNQTGQILTSDEVAEKAREELKQIKKKVAYDILKNLDREEPTMGGSYYERLLNEFIREQVSEF